MFDISASSLFASLLWGAVGSGMVIYGKKQHAEIPLACGLAIGALSYFISSALYMSLASVAILAIMYGLKRQGY